MKVEVTEYGQIWLRAQNKKENNLLEALDKEGVKVSARSTNGIAINSPAIAGLRQLFINREQQAILSYALGTMEINLVAKGFLGASVGDFLQNKQTEQMARNIRDLKDQLLVAPEPVYALPPAPTGRRVAKVEIPKEEPSEENK